MKIQVHDFWWPHVCISSGAYTPMSGIAGLQDRHLLGFSRDCQTGLQSGRTVWPSPQQCTSVPASSHLCQLSVFSIGQPSDNTLIKKGMSRAETRRNLRHSLQVAERSLLLKRAHQNCGDSSLTPETKFSALSPMPPSCMKLSAACTTAAFSIAKEVTLVLLKQRNK